MRERGRRKGKGEREGEGDFCTPPLHSRAQGGGRKLPDFPKSLGINGEKS